MSYEAWGDGDQDELPEGWLDQNQAKDLQDELDEAKRLLTLVYPHIPVSAVDPVAVATKPVSECYLNDLVRIFLAEPKT